MQGNIFSMRVRTVPVWQSWVGRIFGKAIVLRGHVFKQWRGYLYLVKEGANIDQG